MLSYEEAQRRIARHTPPPRTARVPLREALGLVLARAVRAPGCLPRFDNAAVDGYAVRTVHDDGSSAGWRVIGCAEAGRPFRGRLRSGQAVRVYTGAPIPTGTDAVIMQEDVETGDGAMTVRHPPSVGQHIRRAGEDVRRGDVVLRAGARLRPQSLGLLAALGCASAPVYRQPTVAILTTGSELRQPAAPLRRGISSAAGTVPPRSGARLRAGQIYDSNQPLLEALVRQAGAEPRMLGAAQDTLPALVRRLRRGLASADVLLIAGGVSVGDRDYVRPALRRCGVREIFWKVSIKPGMPLWFGRRGRTLVFGLPGNPVSVFVTFEEFVRSVLAALLGRRVKETYTDEAELAHDLRVSARRRTHFVRVRYVGRNGRLRVAPLEDQGSHHLRSLASADGWVRVQSEAGPWPAGHAVRVKPAEAAW